MVSFVATAQCRGIERRRGRRRCGPSGHRASRLQAARGVVGGGERKHGTRRQRAVERRAALTRQIGGQVRVVSV